MQTAALYARYSTENQREASIEDQLRACERVAGNAGLSTVARFHDSAISAGTAERPGYQALLAAARDRVFDVIVAEDISRLWRNRAEYGVRSAELEDLGIHLVTGVGDDTRRDGWGLVLGIKQAIAEAQRREISYRTRRGMEGLALSKKSTGGRCYGYKDAWTIDPEQAQIVREIFAYALHQTCWAIADDLNKRGIVSPGGTRWHDNSVLRIVTNSRYIGDVIYGRTEGRPSAADSRRKRRIRRSKPLVEWSAKELEIVSPELFKRANAALAARRPS